jgi:hypothetical protein
MIAMTLLRLKPLVSCFVSALIAACVCEATAVDSAILLRSNDMICLVGGANLVAAQEHGYFETLLRISFPDLNLKVRNLAHEGDTVFEQPRDYNYPDIERQLNQYRATVVLAQFGQMEVLDRTNRLAQFISAYDALLIRLAKDGRRVALIPPVPFESSSEFRLPNLATRNGELEQWVNEIKRLAERRNAGFVNFFSKAADKEPTGRFTMNGVHLTAEGHWHYDLMIARALGAKARSDSVKLNAVTGALSRKDWEEIRRAVVAKNRLWFNHYRPMNWAFLSGDRTDQPSSRDHDNPKVRWFPEEIKKFEPLLEHCEADITALVADSIRGSK